ncbi:MAG TPA: plasmid mobilization relaxosome protein MobC [Lactovum miscens]|uniref:plasmid mobilization protein n=1 Tax=Lactovum miscens TaxID=190387 RepID=UPI002EDAF648
MANNENRKRPIQKKIRLSAEENEYIKSKVDESPFDNFQNFARNLLIQREVTVKDFTELERLNGQVKRIGNNINQIVKLAHQFDEISEDDIEEVIHLLEEVKNLVTEKLKEEAE